MGARDAVIVGIGWSDYPVAPELDAMDHHALALRRALADCGLEKSAIDGYACAGTAMQVDDAATMAEYLRIDHRWVDGTSVGGSSFEFHVQHAAAAIEAGLCDVVLVTYGSDLLSRMGRLLGTSTFSSGSGRVRGSAQYESPWGNVLAGSYAMAARRHMHEFGTTPEQLAEIAVGVREFAGLNPLAQYRDPITVDDVLNSRLIADPLHKLDCCVISDGGGAFIMTTRERPVIWPSLPSTCSVPRRPRPIGRSARCPTSRPRRRPSAGPRPSDAPVSGRRMSTRSRSTTASPSPC